MLKGVTAWMIAGILGTQGVVHAAIIGPGAVCGGGSAPVSTLREIQDLALEYAARVADLPNSGAVEKKIRTPFGTRTVTVTQRDRIEDLLKTGRNTRLHAAYFRSLISTALQQIQKNEVDLFNEFELIRSTLAVISTHIPAERIADAKLVLPDEKSPRLMKVYSHLCGWDGLADNAQNLEGRILICPGVILRGLLAGRTSLFALTHLIGHELAHQIDQYPIADQDARTARTLAEREKSADYWATRVLAKRSSELPSLEEQKQGIRQALQWFCRQGDGELVAKERLKEILERLDLSEAGA